MADRPSPDPKVSQPPTVRHPSIDRAGSAVAGVRPVRLGARRDTMDGGRHSPRKPEPARLRRQTRSAGAGAAHRRTRRGARRHPAEPMRCCWLAATSIARSSSRNRWGSRPAPRYRSTRTSSAWSKQNAVTEAVDEVSPAVVTITPRGARRRHRLRRGCRLRCHLRSRWLDRHQSPRRLQCRFAVGATG